MYSEKIMQAVRQDFFGLEENDTSMDDKINQMDRIDVLSSYLCWNGIIGYTGTILDAVENIYERSLDE